MLRKATPSDTPAIVSLGIEALESNPYEGLVISRDRVNSLITECVSAACNFAWVSEIDGKVVASVMALVHPNMVYERNCATVVQFYTRVPGEGAKLIRQFLRWARSRPAIKLITFTIDYNADPRIGKLLERMGLCMALPVFIETR